MGADPDPKMGADITGLSSLLQSPDLPLLLQMQNLSMYLMMRRDPKPTLDVVVDPSIATGTPDPNTGADGGRMRGTCFTYHNS
jgi:hypothetical protein